MVAATATYVQAKPTIRIITLTARFIVFLLATDSPGSGNRSPPDYRRQYFGNCGPGSEV